MSEVRQTVDLDVSESVSGLERLAALVAKLDATLSNLGSSQKTALAGAEKAAKDFNQELSETPKNYQKIENSVKGYQKEQKSLKPVFDQLTKSQKEFIAAGDYKNLKVQIQGVKTKIKELGGEFDNAGKKQQKLTSEGEGLFKKYGGLIAAAFSVGVLVDWAKQAGQAILQVTAEFQQFEAVLTTSLGSSSAAQRALLMIQEFAAKTPFSVQELTDSFVRLAGSGIRATTKELTALGDLAASKTKPISQLVEAVLDAMTGQNERLREFGIVAKKTGDTTQFTFKGVTTEVQNTDQAIKEYLISLGEVEGVTGSMANISSTLTGQISNLGDSIDGLWLTIGQQETGVMASFIGFLSEAVEYVTFLVSSTDQLAKKLSAAKVSEFATTTEADFKKLAASTKASGEDVAAALTAQSAAMRQKLENDLALAQKAADAYEEKTGGVASRLAYGPTAAGQVQFNIDKAAEATYRASVAELEGKLAALSDAQRFATEDLQKEEDKAAAEQSEKRIKAAKEAAKKEAAARKKALSDLYKELESLEAQAAKAQLEMINKNSEAYLKAQLDADLQAIEDIRKSIIEKQKAAALAQGLTLEQEEQIHALSLAAGKKYYDALYKLQQEERDKLLDLQKDSDAKELQLLINKYDAEIRAAEEAGKREIAAALEVAKQREILKLGRKQAENNLDSDEELATAFAENTIPDNLSRVEAEQLLQERILDIQIEFAEKRLALVADSLDKEDRIKTLQLENEIQRLKNQQEDLKANAKGFSLQKLLGLDDEQMKAVEQAVSFSLGQLQDFLAASVAMREKEVQALTSAIDEKGEELNREIQLNEQGFASNVETKRQEYEELKVQREKANKERQKAARQQVVLDTALQASNLITSSTEIYKVLSPLGPFGIGLAIATIATMFGTFFAAKAKAIQATSVPTFEKGGEGKLIKGPSHAQGGIDVVENRSGRRIANIQGGENFYVTNKKSTDKYWPFLEAINANDENALARLSIGHLLTGTGVVPHPELPKKVQVLQEGVKIARQEHTARTMHHSYLFNPEVKEMSRNIREMNERGKNSFNVFETDTHRVERKGNYTRTIRK